MLDGPPQYQLGRVTGAVRLGDGTVVVGDDQSKDLRFFDRAGRHLRTVGREGGGPGEFKAVGSLAALGDSLVVADFNNRRVSVFAPDGSLARAIPLDAGGSTDFTFPEGYLGDGSVLLSSGGMFDRGSESGVSRDSVTYLRLPAAGGAPRELGRFVGGEMFVQSGGGAVMVGPRAFGRSAEVEVVPDGFFYGSTDTYEIRRYDASGRLLRLVRRTQEPRAVTPADIERYKAARLKQAAEIRGGRFREMQEKSLAAMSYPETMPAHGPFRADRAGNLWVSEFQVTSDDPGKWTVFDPQGRMLGTVATPARFRVLEIGDDYVLGAWKDELDVDHVRLYPLEKPGAGGQGR